MSEEKSRPAVGRRPLVALRDYSTPAMPTEHAIRRYWRLLRRHFQSDSNEAMSAAARLEPATRKLLDSVAAPPAYGALKDELQAAVDAWHAEVPPGGTWLRAVVLAPCEQGDLVGSWAEEQGHQVVRPPRREHLALSTPLFEWQSLRGEGLLVVPQLERWFLRQRDGLATVRGLIEALSQLERPCLVSCNSWAWAYLKKAAGAGLVLPSAVTFQGLRAKQLNEWFSSLAQREAQAGATIWHGALGGPRSDAADKADGAEIAESAEGGEGAGGAQSTEATEANEANEATEATEATEGAQATEPADARRAKRVADARALAAVDVATDLAPGRPLVFRLASSGADVLTEKSQQRHDADDDNASPARNHEDSYLQRLAARSLGIPWVAWNLWRDGLRAARESDQVPQKVKETVQDDAHTLWVSDLPEFSLPMEYERASLMVVHALLLHGALTRSQLQGVLSAQEQPGVLAALLSAGYLEWADAATGRNDDPTAANSSDDERLLTGHERELRVRPSAYPALHTALRTAGFPTGEF